MDMCAHVHTHGCVAGRVEGHRRMAPRAGWHEEGRKTLPRHRSRCDARVHTHEQGHTLYTRSHTSTHTQSMCTPCARTRAHTRALYRARASTHVRTHAHTHGCTRMHRRTDVRALAHTHSRMHACTHARMHACTHARMHACTHARMHACTQACIDRGCIWSTRLAATDPAKFDTAL